MSDRIAVVNHGRIEQLGTPEELYRRPKSYFVADFIGESVTLPVRVAGQEAWLGTQRLRTSGPMPEGRGTHWLVIRPELLQITEDRAAGDVNDMSGRVQDVIYQGDSVLVLVRHDSGVELTVRVSANRANKGGVPSIGDPIPLALHADDTIVVPEAMA
jgi:putative spermidine/putrescine transport system ATP-binding protein